MNKQQQKKLITEVMNEDAKDGLYYNKPFNIALVRDIMDHYDLGEISFSRMVEMLNEIAIKWHENHIVDTNKMVEHHIVDTNKMITAVEWLIQKINQDYPEMTWAYKEECEQAKAMEKEQIVIAHGTKSNGRLKNDGQFIIGEITGEQYYNETYNK